MFENYNFELEAALKGIGLTLLLVLPSLYLVAVGASIQNQPLRVLDAEVVTGVAFWQVIFILIYILRRSFKTDPSAAAGQQPPQSGYQQPPQQQYQQRQPTQRGPVQNQQPARDQRQQQPQSQNQQRQDQQHQQG
ncbi:hypothetical protein [Halorhabdus amylolytica]|uniref:hypothetical protein n=1 Tax=Halorhabdus amylolytica TaxID=2559573 RepID=UPI0010A9AC2E|nr:hypothetical protein [Halorhabdus amylolytica]